MNNEKQRIAIAEACGIVGPFDNRWIKEYEEEGGDSYGFTGFEKGELVFIPDYLNDLNAMHEAEQSLWLKDWNLRYVFCDHLADMIRGRRVNRNEWGPELMLDATTAHRAEAFLKTIGKWAID